MSSHVHLAQLNIARLLRPLDAAENAEFVAALAPINAIAEATPGFVWRLQDANGASAITISIDGVEDPLVVPNFSIWTDLDAFRHFVYKSGHQTYLRRRREWFAPMAEAHHVCWWIEAGARPTLDEAWARLEQLRRKGPSDDGWTLDRPIDPNDATPERSRDGG